MTTTDLDLYFGACPACHCTDGYINIGKGHWFYCNEHKVRWCAGSNLFSTWKMETETDQRETYDRMRFDTFADVEPWYRTSG